MQDPNETQKLSETRRRILEQINKVADGLKSRRDNVIEARRSMSKATGIIRDFDDVVLLTMFVTEVAQQEQAYGETSKQMQRLQRMLNAPYFARIDFIEDDYDGLEEIYIGRHSLLDELTHTYHVYDWRAPISSLYYDYGVGRARFNIPAASHGELPPVEGEILLKRQYQIEKGELKYFFDSDMAVEDDILRLELSKASDAKIKTIIHSIQKEQNAAIRSESSDVLVFGPAGSGKTSVGLHRLAYLLYRHRDTLSSAKVRIFSPSPIFASYIEGIIPDLGEDDVETLDFPGLLEEYSPEKRLFHDQYQQIEYLAAARELSEQRGSDDFCRGGILPPGVSTMRGRQDAAPTEHLPLSEPHLHSEFTARASWLKEKYSPDFIAHLEQYIKNYAPSFEDVRFSKDKLCDKDRLAALYADRTTAGTLATKSARVMTYVNQRYDEYYQKNKPVITELFNAIHDDNFTSGEIRRLYEEEKNIVLADLRGRLMPRARRLYERVLKGWGKGRNLSVRMAREALRQDKLYFEDALMLLYIDILTGRVSPEKTVKHILIDEAQDISIVQHRILRRLFTDSHFTVLADVNQALYPDINLHTQAELQAEHPKAKVIPLTTSYRSTYEISRFAANVLAGRQTTNESGDAAATLQNIDTSNLYMRSGDEPTIIQNKNPAVATWDIIRELPKGYNTVGILLSTTKETRRFYEKLTETQNTVKDINRLNDTSQAATPIKLIASTNANFGPGIMVMALPYAKGLEFDAVICPEYGSAIFDGPLGRKMLYLICTRALHSLYLIKA